MNGVEIVFWICAFVVFYTYLGYGILLYILVRIKEFFVQPSERVLPDQLDSVTILIAAYNEQSVVEEKMRNTLALNYPHHLLNIVWVTDGSNDFTNDLLAKYRDVKVLFRPERMGKSAALNRAMGFVTTQIVIFTDANTMLCEDAVMEIVSEFSDPNVGCVAGEKRVAQSSIQDATAGEGFYWRYESVLKSLDYRLYSAVGAAGELFAVRTALYEHLSNDTLLDDFVLSLKIAQRGYKIAYCKSAYAIEDGSADMAAEAKRKVRIAAGGLQSIWRLRGLLNIFRYGVLSFQYLSHRVLRWSITPLALFVMLPLNIVLVYGGVREWLYAGLLAVQIVFYTLGLIGSILARREIKSKAVFIPYYFLFMNVCVIRGAFYLVSHRGTGAWERARRR